MTEQLEEPQFKKGQLVVDRLGYVSKVVRENYRDEHAHDHVDVKRSNGVVSGEGLNYFIYDAVNLSLEA